MAMAGDEDVTLGELGRLIASLRDEVRDIPRSFLALQVWEVEKRGLEESRRAMGREIAQLRTTIETMQTEKKAEHKAFDLELDAIRAEAAAKAEQARKARAQVWLAVGLSAFAAILAVGGNLLTGAITGGA